MNPSYEPLVGESLPSPSAVRSQFPCTGSRYQRVLKWRNEIKDILAGRDNRLLLVVGPCSVHNPTALIEYATRLSQLRDKVSDRLFLVMRTYLEKPRTRGGWTGFLYDPSLDGSYRIAEGLLRSRELLANFVGMNLPVATEFLDPNTPAYFSDLISWGSVGSRTSESQPHRQMVSGLSIPTGFKNSTDGSIDAAINGIKVALQPNTFIGVNEQGTLGVVRSKGNPCCHMVLRGGSKAPNYHPEAIQTVTSELEAQDLPTGLIVDCSHDNSRRDPLRQIEVFRSVIQQSIDGNATIRGMILESYLKSGKQKTDGSSVVLAPDISITDSCLGWAETEKLLLEAHEALARDPVAYST